MLKYQPSLDIFMTSCKRVLMLLNLATVLLLLLHQEVDFLSLLNHTISKHKMKPINKLFV